jgi:hypothetical protein
MERVFRLIRGKKAEFVSRLSPESSQVWRVVRNGSAMKKGDVVCSKRPMALEEAAERVACWRTKVGPHELVLLKPVEGGGEMGAGDPVAPYADLLPFVRPLGPVGRPDPAA